MRVMSTIALIAVFGFGAPMEARAADNYAVDPVHSSVSFFIGHAGISEVHGRFNEVAGQLVIDAANPSASTFSLTIPIASVDSNNKKRDDHLRSPDFFNAKQFPELTFQSTSVKPIKDGYEVTGDVTLHGATKPVKFVLRGGKTVEFPKGVQRIGFVTSFSLKRSDFGVGSPEGLGDDVRVAIGLEGTKN